MQTPKTEREMDLQVFAAELGAHYVTGGLMEGYEDALNRWAETPRWRFLRRRKLLHRADMMADLYRCVGGYVSDQERAWRERRR